MSIAVYGLLDRFDHLTLDEQREFLTEILQRTRDLEWPPLDQEVIEQIANEMLLESDAPEAVNGNS
jgi:hypothetical protein